MSSVLQDVTKPGQLQPVMPSQVNVISVDDEDFSTDDEHVGCHGYKPLKEAGKMFRPEFFGVGPHEIVFQVLQVKVH